MDPPVSQSLEVQEWEPAVLSLSRSPYTLSVRVFRVTVSNELLVTRTVNWTGPPGSGRLAGFAALFTVMDGLTSTKAVSVSDTGLPWELVAVAVAVFVVSALSD